ncbi:LytR family transcriptional regulator [Streptomyces hoynatensis]|uniref:LytR family transcriptional regulator n=1 Tax=Streptomyces hoynatensis TaxID=1141874 RepID=A0A3A9YMT4_9ACTN|nr:LytR family transcriptional regulator [Streptomyces hoynatensis]
MLVWSAGSLAFLVVAVAAAGYLYIRHLNNNLDKEDLNLGDNQLARSQPNADGQTPLNILLLGSDSRDGEENADLGGGGEGGERADVQILLHASADRSNISMLSVPRDLMVHIPECTDPDTGETYPEMQKERINAALGHGGPGCVVATWEDLTGIPIDHFMMIDFAGVVDMADAVGGVEVCVQDNVRDPDSHLEMTAGTHEITGEDALHWLRTRHGFGDGSDNTGRTRAQQMYLSNMVEQLQESATLSHPGDLMDLAEAATNALTVDHGLGSVQKLYDLGNDLKSVPNDRINMTTLPTLPDPDNPNVTLVPDPDRDEPIFDLIREDIAFDDQDAEPEQDDSEGGDQPEADPEDQIQVAVRNGTGSDLELPVDHRASDIADQLVSLGFTQATADSTAASEETSQVLYPGAEDQANAKAVAQALGMPGSAVRTSPNVDGITLIVGGDWREGTSYPEQTDDSGETGGEREPIIEEDEITSGRDNDECMPVNVAGGYSF